MRFSTELGVASVHRARRAMLAALDRPVEGPGDADGPFAQWKEKGGAFVTLRTFPEAELRGCIGFPRPVLPLGRAIDEAAVAAAREDPRFPPVDGTELDHLVVEVSLLTVPERIAADDAAGRRAAVVVGRDGLIVSAGGGGGLLLPQVAVEEGWDAEQFLAMTGVKAGLGPDAWRRASTQVERFEAAVFAEVAPGGDVAPVLSGPGAEPRAERRRGASRR